MCGFKNLRTRFDRAGTRDEDNIAAADLKTINWKDGVFRMKLSRGKFERLCDSLDHINSIQDFEAVSRDIMRFTDGANHGGFNSLGQMRCESRFLDLFDNIFNLLGGAI